MSDNEQAALTAAQHDTLSGYTALNGTRIHEHTRQAIEDMAYKGLPLPQAAQRHGIRPDNLARALRRKDVRRAYNQLLSAIRENAAQQAYLRINDMSMTADSEHVRLKANEWVAGVDGIAKVHKVEGNMHHSITFGGFDYPSLGPKDITGTAQDVVSDDDDD